MHRKIIAGVTLAVIGVLVGAALVIHKDRARPALTLRLRITVSPPDQSAFVAGQAQSAQFKYLIGKYAGLKPVLAQKLSAHSRPNSSEVEVQVEVDTPEEGRRYVEACVETLQTLCGHQVQLALAGQSIQ